MRTIDHVSLGTAGTDDLAVRVRVTAEFLEMPGEMLTLAQAVRLFNLDRTQCQRLLGDLVATGVLRTDGRAFVRGDMSRR